MFATSGNKKAPIMVITDAPSQITFDMGVPLADHGSNFVAAMFGKEGFNEDDFFFVNPCPDIPEIAQDSDARTRKFIEEHRGEFLQTVRGCSPKVILTFGKAGALQLLKRNVAVTKARGKVHRYEGVSTPVMHFVAPGLCLRRPEYTPTFETDVQILRMFVDAGYNEEEAFGIENQFDYRWCTDLAPFLAMQRRGEIPVAALDTETTGLRWFDTDKVRPLTVQLTWKSGKAIAIPLCREFWPDISGRALLKLKGQVREFVAGPTQFIGHNTKFDAHIMRGAGLPVREWACDTLNLAFLADENMQEKSLTECVRRWVPAMAGYSDEFDRTVDKSKMIEVPHDQFLQYAGGDTDANWRLVKALYPIVRRDPAQWRCHSKIIKPAMDGFMECIEPEGMLIDTNSLLHLQEALDVTAAEQHEELLSRVPLVLRQKHAEKGLKFSRPDFVKDILFSQEGLGLIPTVFTKSTARLAEEDRVPSTSTKDHLPYFADNEFVSLFIDYKKLDKMRSTYVGRPAHEQEVSKRRAATPEEKAAKIKGPFYTTSFKPVDAKGLWQHLHAGKIHSSFFLHNTVTGRTSSANPNAQNFPKRGKGSMKDVIKAFRRTMIAPPGYVMCEADLSQAELRLIAWKSGCPTMLGVYREGGDIHAMTAANNMGITQEQFYAQEKDDIDFARFKAKASNFGYCYGMWWRKFKVYAKTDYGLDYTDDEARIMRERFFATYDLEQWHAKEKAFARKHGYVQALHGAKRHLPSVFSLDEGVVKEAERQAVNSPIQRFASDLGVMALGRLCRDAPRELIKPVAFIHDAIVTLIREDYVEEGAAAIKWYMENNPLQEWFNLTPPIPLLSDVSLGPNMADMVELEGAQAVRPDWHNRAADGLRQR